jgi:PDZ domain
MPLRSVALFLLLLSAAELSFAKDPALMSLAPDHFRDTSIINDDPVAGVTTVSTQKGYVEHHGPLRAVWNDEYLFGIVDRKAARKTFEVITLITYRGSRRSYASARLQGATGTTAVPTVPMKTSSLNCPTGECTYTDQLSFPVDESLLRQLAAHATDKPELWHYTLIEPSGNYTGELSTAEIAGFLAKIDEYTGAAPPPPPALTAKPELGIGGLKVEPTAQNPSRYGVLVTAVVPGSVADKAGIIVGDIVSEVSGHPIKGPADLQSAMASIPASSGITFKIYRGMAEMSLNGRL